MYSDINCLYVYTRTKILVKNIFFGRIAKQHTKAHLSGKLSGCGIGVGLFFARSLLVLIGRCPILVMSPLWGYGFYISLQMYDIYEVRPRVVGVLYFVITQRRYPFERPVFTCAC